MATRTLSPTTIRAELHHVDDETAHHIVAVDNHAANLGTHDERLLAGLDDLAATGYDEDALVERRLADSPVPNLGEPTAIARAPEPHHRTPDL